jgi:hypothetical protein
MTMAVDHEDVFHPDTKEFGGASGFWWLEGTATCPMYCCTVLWRTSKGRSKTASYRTASSVALAAKMEREGWDPLPPEEIARLTESAGCSRHITKSSQFVSEVRWKRKV